jgi:hypothetical protein
MGIAQVSFKGVSMGLNSCQADATSSNSCGHHCLQGTTKLPEAEQRAAGHHC